jgi:hypothetical protein
MRLSFHAHFDGRVIVPEEPISLQPGQALEVEVVVPEPEAAALSIEQRRQAVVQFFSRSVGDVSIPSEALRRESIYEDRV